MGKTALLLVAASIISISVMNRTRNAQSFETTANQSEFEAGQVASQYAQSALNIAIGRVQNDFENYRPTFTGHSFKDGLYDLDVTGETCGPASISVSGVYGNERRTIMATVTIDAAMPAEEPPSFMARGLTAGNNVTLRDVATLSAPSPVNDNLHADGNLTVKMAGTRIQGFGSAGNTLKNETGEADAVVFSPNSNPDGDPVAASGADEIGPPRPDRDAIEAVADVVWSDSEISGTLAMGGTPGDPTIWVFTSAVETGGPVTFTGNGIVLFRGNLKVKHDLTNTGGTLALYVYNDFTLDPGEMKVNGLLYVGNNITARTPLAVNGTVTSGNDTTTEDALVIGYNPITSPFYTPNGWTPASGSAGGGTCPGGTYTFTVSDVRELTSD